MNLLERMNKASREAQYIAAQKGTVDMFLQELQKHYHGVTGNDLMIEDYNHEGFAIPGIAYVGFEHGHQTIIIEPFSDEVGDDTTFETAVLHGVLNTVKTQEPEMALMLLIGLTLVACTNDAMQKVSKP